MKDAIPPKLLEFFEANNIGTNEGSRLMIQALAGLIVYRTGNNPGTSVEDHRTHMIDLLDRFIYEIAISLGED